MTLLSFAIALPTWAQKSDETPLGQTSKKGVEVWLRDTFKHTDEQTTSSHFGTSTSAGQGPRTEVTYVPACSSNFPGSAQEVLCPAALACPQNSITNGGQGGYVMIVKYTRQLNGSGVPAGAWTQGATRCVGPRDPAVQQASQGPSLVELIMRAWRRVELTPSRVVAQPPGGTLVNLPAILHTDDATQTFDVTLLGRAVRITAVPVAYEWRLGDGTSLTSSGPGRPYPARDVTHTYRQPGTFPLSVAVTHRGEFTVDGGAAQPLPGRTTVVGPAEELPVYEAKTRLVAD